MYFRPASLIYSGNQIKIKSDAFVRSQLKQYYF